MNFSFNQIYPHIEVEPWFDEMVRGFPMACVLKDKIPNPDFLNADYIFHHEKVVAELKCIQVDNTGSESNQAKINRALEKFHAEGKIKTKEVTEENWPGLPMELQNEIYQITTNAIRGRITKANRQLRETKEKLGLSSYQGALFLCNDGVQSYAPAAFVHAAARLIQKDFREISFFIAFTANVFAMTRELRRPTSFWIGLDMEKFGLMDRPFSNRLYESWKSIISAKTGIVSVHQEMDDMEGFWKAKNLPK